MASLGPPSFGSPDTGGRYITPELLSSGYFAEEYADEDRRLLLAEPYPTNHLGQAPLSTYWSYAAPADDVALDHPRSSDPSAYGPPSSSMRPTSATTHPQYFPSLPLVGPGMTKADSALEEHAAAMLEGEHDLMNSYGFHEAILAGMDLHLSSMESDSQHQVHLPCGYRS